MADPTSIFSGGPWIPPAQADPLAPIDQLREAMIKAGITPPERLVLDGKIHRFPGVGGGAHDKSGWYVGFLDGVPAGRYGCWRAGIESQWRADIGRTLSIAEEMSHAARIAESILVRDQEMRRQRAVAADTVDIIWSGAQSASGDHPYLELKKILAHGARVTGDGRLVVPLFHPDGHLSSLQYIDFAGGKLYHAGGQTSGCSWEIGGGDPGVGPIYIAEGFATAATIHQATSRPCVVAFSASNLVPVARALREKLGSEKEIIIVADHDSSGTGAKYADLARAASGARVVMPSILGDANDYVAAGHDLILLLHPPIRSDQWLVPADKFSEQPAPVRWLLKNWLQAEALTMVHGPSGSGKTFMVLDWCLRIAGGKKEWFGGCRISPGAVVYLAGEGHHGLRSRIAAWKHHHSVSSVNMWVSRHGCDLNTAQGYQQVVENIRSLGTTPALIVVDTLHRFLAGDENSAQDARTMLESCADLIREFVCSVVLVHHTGVSEEAQHRARGSSAWRGALDGEISVVPGAPTQVIQRKAKDSEIAPPLAFELLKVTIPGWVDEDGHPASSAVLVESVVPEKRHRLSKFDQHRKTLEASWWASGAEDRDSRPYVSRDGLLDYLINQKGLTENTAKLYLMPGRSGQLISDLLEAGIIAGSGKTGWVVIDESNSSAMMLRKNATIKTIKTVK